MTERLACPPAPGPLEEYAAQFDALFNHVVQRRSYREYLMGLLLPRDRNKTLTALAGVEPVVGAQDPAAQRLQGFVSESTWDPEALNTRRLELVLEDPVTMPHEQGALVIDETGDRKAGKQTDHVARQYLGSVGKVDNGIVAVTSLWADERVYYPLHARPYTPAERLPKGKADPAFQTKPEIALELVDLALSAGVVFRAVVADCLYGEHLTFERTLSAAGLPYVMGLKPTKGIWAPEEAIHSPKEAAEALRWNGPEDPGDWTKVVRVFRDGHEETWWAAELVFGNYGPDRPRRRVVATTDPRTLPILSTWYLGTNLPHPDSPGAVDSLLAPADLAEVVRLYGLRNWVEQSYKQVKDQLGWADFMVRFDEAIRRHWYLVYCAFSFCWQAWFRRRQAGEPPAESPETTPAQVVSLESDRVTVAEAEPWRWGKNEGQPREATEDATRDRQLADGSAAGSVLAGSLAFPLALVAGVVRFAPATRTTGPSQLGW